MSEKLVGLVEQAGPETHLDAYNMDVVPCMIDPKKAIDKCLSRYKESGLVRKRIMDIFAKFMLHGINPDTLTSEQKEQFARCGII